MPLARVYSGTVVGLDPILVEVEVHIEEQGFPAFKIVGLPDKAVDESRERVRSAIKNSGADFPVRRITVNLAPADLPKQGPVFDLAIALGVLSASGQLAADLSGLLVLGELSLDGSLRHTQGILPLAILASQRGFSGILVPKEDAREAAVVSDIAVYPVPSLYSSLLHFLGEASIRPAPDLDFEELLSTHTDFGDDLIDVRGQEQAKRALEVAASGGHNLLFRGPPGSGKTMLARTLPSILPALTVREALEITKIYSVTGNLPRECPLVLTRPFRSPHHTTSRVGLIGGGSTPTPGEISLAHRGVLFLDEFPELPRAVLEALRQPLEDGVVTVSRAAGTLTFPARFILVVAANPCLCGYLGSSVRECTCSPSQIARYQKRVSGPILDRIDLHVEVPAVKVEKLTDSGGNTGESSAVVYQRVQQARVVQEKRFSGTGLTCNAEMRTKDIKRFCQLDDEAKVLLSQAVDRLGLSARAYFRVIKVAQTISDLAGEQSITSSHVGEALSYRSRVE